MSTNIVKHSPAADLVTFTPEQIQLIKRTICKPRDREATNDELALFVGQAKRSGLDPFNKQIYAIFRYDRRAGREVMTIQTAIDGFRLIAERTGKYLGPAGTWWCGMDRVWHEVWIDSARPFAAKVTVRKILNGHIAEVPSVAHWSEYASDQGLWKTMPANQLAKCAEALALRRAFPNDLSGLYTPEEMDQADRPARAVPPVVNEPPAPDLTDSEISELARAIDGAGWSEDEARMQLIAAGASDVPDVATGLRSLRRDQIPALIAAITEAGGEPDGEIADAEEVR